MLNLNIGNKGGSDFLRGSILFYLVFFLAVESLATMGAGVFMDVEELPEIGTPDEPTPGFFGGLVDGLDYAFSSMGYFFALLIYSPDFAMFTTLLIIPFVLLVLMYIIETGRGN